MIDWSSVLYISGHLEMGSNMPQFVLSSFKLCLNMFHYCLKTNPMCVLIAAFEIIFVHEIKIMKIVSEWQRDGMWKTRAIGVMSGHVSIEPEETLEWFGLIHSARLYGSEEAIIDDLNVHVCKASLQ